jgi:hypothetical protein
VTGGRSATDSVTHVTGVVAHRAADGLMAGGHLFRRAVSEVRDAIVHGGNGKSRAIPDPTTWPAVDDKDVDRIMHIVDGMSEEMRRELIRSFFRGVIAFDRTNDEAHLAYLARSAIVSVDMHATPGYSKALRDAPKQPAPADSALDARKVLAELGFES